MAGVPGSPLNELVTCLCEFLEAAVHTVLASRGLYHKDVFERCKVFNVFTRRSRHPELNSYISSTVARLRPLVESDSLRELAVVFVGPEGRAVERVTFLTQFLAQGTALQHLDVAALEASFGSVILKLQFIDSLLPPLPQGEERCCTFELAAYSMSRQGVDVQYFGEDSSASLELAGPIAAQPLKTLHLDSCLHMQVLLEEAARA